MIGERDAPSHTLAGLIPRQRWRPMSLRCPAPVPAQILECPSLVSGRLGDRNFTDREGAARRKPPEVVLAVALAADRSISDRKI